MASYNPVVKNGASGAIFYVSLAPRTATGAWQDAPTLAAGDVQISKDGGALANLTTLPVVTPASSKLVKVTLSQAETNADNLIVIFSDAAGEEWCDLTICLQTASDNFDSLATDIAAVQADTDNIQTRLPAALVSGRIDASVGAMATDVLTNTALAASAVTEIQTGLATPTNITAGTITTVTNLTNAPTAGDFTATMKASITAAVPTAAAITTAVWAAATRLLTAGTNIVLAKGTGVTGFNDISAAQVTAAVPTAAQNATELLDQAAGVETGLTVRGALRLALAALAGKVSGAGTVTEIFRNSVADTKPRITSTVDASGNRTAITTDVT